jgi:intracellular septation protein A
VESVPFQIPRVRLIVRHAFPRILEGTIVPVALFVLALHFTGVTGAVTAGLAWTYSAIGVRLLTRRRIPGILLLGAMTLTARSALTYATGSTFVYFLQPTLGTALVAFAFLVSVPTGRPLVERLASDFCPIPATLFDHAPVRQIFLRLTLLWAAAQFANAAVTLYLLLSQSVGVFVVTRTIASLVITAVTIAISAVWFIRSMRRAGVLAARATRV